MASNGLLGLLGGLGRAVGYVASSVSHSGGGGGSLGNLDSTTQSNDLDIGSTTTAAGLARIAQQAQAVGVRSAIKGPSPQNTLPSKGFGRIDIGYTNATASKATLAQVAKATTILNKQFSTNLNKTAARIESVSKYFTDQTARIDTQVQLARRELQQMNAKMINLSKKKSDQIDDKQNKTSVSGSSFLGEGVESIVGGAVGAAIYTATRSSALAAWTLFKPFLLPAVMIGLNEELPKLVESEVRKHLHGKLPSEQPGLDIKTRSQLQKIEQGRQGAAGNPLGFWDRTYPPTDQEWEDAKKIAIRMKNKRLGITVGGEKDAGSIEDWNRGYRVGTEGVRDKLIKAIGVNPGTQDDDSIPAKARPRQFKPLSDGTQVLESTYDVKISSKANVDIIAKNDVEIKGRKLTLSGESIILDSRDIRVLGSISGLGDITKRSAWYKSVEEAEALAATKSWAKQGPTGADSMGAYDPFTAKKQPNSNQIFRNGIQSGLKVQSTLPQGHEPIVDIKDKFGSMANVPVREFKTYSEKGEKSLPGEFNYGLTKEGSDLFSKSGLSTVVLARSGKKVVVSSAYARDWKAFYDQLEARGYNIKSIGGYAARTTASGRPSQHAEGNAVDINPWEPNSSQMDRIHKTDFPKNAEKLGWVYGISWLGHGAGDAMHFEHMSPAAHKLKLQQLVKEGFITQDQSDQAQKQDYSFLGSPDNSTIQQATKQDKLQSSIDTLQANLPGNPFMNKGLKGGPTRAGGIPSALLGLQRKDTGYVSAKYESGGDWALGHRDNEGWSYGKWQMNSRSDLPKFLAEYPQYAKQFNGLDMESQAFANKWAQLAEEPGFREAQKTHMLKELEGAGGPIEQARKLGYNVNNPGVYEAILSSTQQHGVDATKNMLEQAAPNGARELTVQDQIKNLYEQRGERTDYLEKTKPNFPASAGRPRYEREVVDALKAAEKPDVTLPKQNNETESIRQETTEKNKHFIKQDSDRSIDALMTPTTKPNMLAEALKPLPEPKTIIENAKPRADNITSVNKDSLTVKPPPPKPGSAHNTNHFDSTPAVNGSSGHGSGNVDPDHLGICSV